MGIFKAFNKSRDSKHSLNTENKRADRTLRAGNNIINIYVTKENLDIQGLIRAIKDANTIKEVNANEQIQDTTNSK